jgi:hypothetical protein
MFITNLRSLLSMNFRPNGVEDVPKKMKSTAISSTLSHTKLKYTRRRKSDAGDQRRIKVPKMKSTILKK